MKKYWLIFKAGLQDAIEYRGELLLWILVDILPLVVMVFLWTSIYQTRQEIEGFSLSSLLTYYLLLTIVHSLVDTHFDGWLMRDIRDGEIVKYLIKPLRILPAIISKEVGWKVLRNLLFLPGLLLLVRILQPLLSFSIDFENLVLLAPVVTLGFLNLVFINFVLSFTAFWLDEARILSHAKWILISFFSGSFVPLPFLPDSLEKMADVLPFKYLHYFPVSVLLGTVRIEEVFRALLVETLWIAIFFGVVTFLWKRGLVKFSAVGR